MPADRQVVAVLFADVADFSMIKDDRLISELQNHITAFIDTHVSSINCLYKNTWGDSVVLACADPNDALEYALQLRDWFTNHNWQRRGFPQALHVRIGLHTEKVTLIKSGAEIKDISGKNVNLAARIEPIVKLDSIYCTEAFHVLVKEEASSFVTFKDLGTKELAKGFGSTRLFEILRGLEPQPTDRPVSPRLFGVSIPKIRKDYTDAEKEAFLEEGFDFVREYFRRASEVLEHSDPDVKVQVKDAASNKFTCQVFVRGTRKAQCQILLGKDIYSYGLLACSHRVDLSIRIFPIRTQLLYFGMLLRSSFNNVHRRNVSFRGEKNHERENLSL